MSDCRALDNTTPCGASFAGLPIVASDFSSSANFTAVANQQLGNPHNLADDLIAGTGWSQDDVRSAVVLGALRYQMAYFCSATVQRAVSRGCVLPASRQGDHVLCPEQCDAATNSVRAVFANRALCPAVAEGSAQARARDRVGDAFATFCSSVSRANQAAGNTCQAGVQSERCGMYSVKILLSIQDVLTLTCCSKVTWNETLRQFVDVKMQQTLAAGEPFQVHPLMRLRQQPQPHLLPRPQLQPVPLHRHQQAQPPALKQIQAMVPYQSSP